MKIDIWTHMLSRAYVEHLEVHGQRRPGAFLMAQRALRDIEFRLRVIDEFGDYRQVLTPIPGMHVFGSPSPSGPKLVEVVRRNNEQMAEMVAAHVDRFAGFVAATPVTEPDAATDEAIRSVRELGALGVQLEEDAINLPLHEDRYDPLFAAMEELRAGVWLHPFRTPATPGSPPETAPFLLWQLFGWTVDTTITISRLIFAGLYDRHPDLKLIAQHGGGLIPHFSGRLEVMPAFANLDPSGSLGEALGRLKKRPIDYFRMLYVDTAMFGGQHGMRCVVDFFGPERVLFGTDAPFDAQGGSYFIPRTIADIASAIDNETARSAIFEGNASEVLGIEAALQT
jgi:aminocarboxymuconate-semialdehyde decarboxylase